ncbi:DUF5709 domain-containing protein [Streptomyces sp. B6B3]|uniref:DUF5709 domain-containing protein n=1 Tax=Streptomyces sp. B6B3 TaxID=3153570 RepID=UPI00325EEECB
MSDETTRRASGDDPMGDDVYQPNETEQEGVTYTGDLENALDEADYDDVLDTGYSPPEKPRGVNAHGTTAREQRDGETLDQRLAEEVPDVEPPPGDGIGDQPGMWGEPVADGQAGEDRAGRLVASNDAVPRRLDDVTAQDVGIDGGAAGAEEASMHLITTDEVASSDQPDESEETEETGAAEEQG